MVRTAQELERVAAERELIAQEHQRMAEEREEVARERETVAARRELLPRGLRWIERLDERERSAGARVACQEGLDAP